MDPAIGIGVVAKLIGLGIKGWQALEHRDFDKDDVEALRAFLDTGASLWGMRKAGVDRGAAMHIALIARAFGRAVGRHQMFHGKVTLAGGLRRWMNRNERQREREIQLRVKIAMLRPPD